MLRNYLCKALSHRIDRHRVWHDGIDYRTNCVRCGAPLLRDPDGWREFNEIHDNHLNRLPHPRDRGQGDAPD